MKSFIPSSVRARHLLALGIAATGQALAQSSGNFTYSSTGNSVNCQLDDGSGNISGGYTCQSSGGTFGFSPQSGTCLGSFSAGIKTSSGTGNVFDIRPSMVIGLLTDVSIDKNTQTSSSYAGVNVAVAVEGPGTVKTVPNFPVTYDARYIQISSNLFNALTQACVAGSTVAAQGCYFSFSESTVSAHSFDWLATNLTSGTYTIKANWWSTTGGSGNFRSLACVGPVNVTTTQNKVFSFNSANTF